MITSRGARTLRDNVVALYVDPLGPYPRLVREWYDETRDARSYAGPWPVVAHPPCGPYSRLRHFASKQAALAELAPIAVDQVRQFGGVLEHPAGSTLWRHCMLPLPGELPDAHGGYSIAVDQVDFGHVARKRTWLYLVIPRGQRFTFPARGTPTHCIASSRKSPHIKFCSVQQRRRTPVVFAEWLLELAAASARPAPRREKDP